MGQPFRLPAARLPVPARCASRRRRLPGRPRPLRCSSAPGIAPPPGGAGARSCSGRAGSWIPSREEAAEVPAGEGGAEAPRSGGTGKKVAWRGPGWCVGGRGPRRVRRLHAPNLPLGSNLKSARPVPCLWPVLPPTSFAGRPGPPGVRVSGCGASRLPSAALATALLPVGCVLPLFWVSPSPWAASNPAFAHRPLVPGLAWEETSVAPPGSRNGVMTSRCAGKRPAPPPGAARPSGSVGAGRPPPPQ